MTAATDIPMPPNVARLPMDPKRHHPVPWFVAWVNGEPDYRVADKYAEALRFSLCWICGQPMGRYRTFVIGPMCMINRNTVEPPAHLPCAVWSAQVCPFLARPHARRRPNNLPDGAANPGGLSIPRNPGVVLLWTTRQWQTHSDGAGGILIRLGDPTGVQWWAEGRGATRAEVDESIAGGLPILRDMAEQEGPDAVAELAALVRASERYLPVDELAGAR